MIAMAVEMLNEVEAPTWGAMAMVEVTVVAEAAVIVEVTAIARSILDCDVSCDEREEWELGCVDETRLAQQPDKHNLSGGELQVLVQHLYIELRAVYTICHQIFNESPINCPRPTDNCRARRLWCTIRWGLDRDIRGVLQCKLESNNRLYIFQC